MFATKRPDKYTTGLINVANDCFANSDLQALSSLPVLNEYLLNMSAVKTQIPLSTPLHDALIEMLGKMQETIYTNKVLSVWDLLHVIETIYSSRISRSQHDAQELLQLILETLLKEYIRLKKVYEQNPAVQDALANESSIERFPSFPFASETASHLHCMRCGKSSSVSYNPMMVISLGLPQENSVSLETLLKRNESEVIEDYSCLVCKIRYVLATKDKLITKPDKLEMVERLRKIADTVLINDDLPPDLENFLDQYPGIKDKQIKSTVHRELNIVRPPEVLIIHLSRSIYETQAYRNACKVNFSDHLNIAVDPQQVAEYAKHAKTEDDIEELSLPPSFNPTLTPLSKGNAEHFETVCAGSGSGSDDPTQISSNTTELVLSDVSDSTSSHSFGGTSGKDLYTYDMRAMIRHLGQHSMGHYECYKKKPMYYKSAADKDYYRVFPELRSQDTTTTPNSSAVREPLHRKSTSKFRSRVSSIVKQRSLSTSDVPQPERAKIKKDKKLGSCAKHPYWKISDDRISECTTNDVLSDNGNVYMLFYERQRP